MTALCSGGPSAPKATSPGAAFFTGATLQTILVEVFGLTEAWAALLVYAAGQAIDTPTFCASDPPTLVWPSASDILAILDFDPINGPAASVKLASVVENGLWNYLCECTSISTPAPPTPPAYPTGGAQVNPPGTGSPTVGHCWDKTFQYNANDEINGLSVLTEKMFPSASSTHVYMFPPGFANLTIIGTAFSDGTVNGYANANLIFANADGSLDTPEQFGLSTNNVGGPPFANKVTIPSDAFGLLMQTSGLQNAGQNNTISWEVIFDCSPGANLIPVTPCCPPDPTLQARIDQMYQLLQAIYSGLPSAPNSFSESTVHSGLTASGSFSLGTGPVLAIRVELTTIPTSVGLLVGNPNRYFNAGVITTSAAEGAYRSHEITLSPQIFLLGELVDQIHYTLTPNVVATVTELTRGP